LNTRVYDPDFWRTYCAEVLDQIIADARDVLDSAGVPAEDEILFNMFQVLTMNFAVLASDQPNMRKLAGIKRGWFS
jgi:hypothetical protein